MEQGDPEETNPSSSPIISPPKETGEEEEVEEREIKLSSRVVSLLLGDLSSPGQVFEKWLALVRERSAKFRPSGFPRRNSRTESMPSGCLPPPSLHDQSGERTDTCEFVGDVVNTPECDQLTEMSLWERLGKAAMLNIESSDFSWDLLSSLHHTEHNSSTEHSEDELSKVLESGEAAPEVPIRHKTALLRVSFPAIYEIINGGWRKLDGYETLIFSSKEIARNVTVNSGGVVFFTLFDSLVNDEQPPEEAAAVIKIASSRMATQAERLGYEFAKWLGVQTPQARVIHNSSSEWQRIKDATEKAREAAVSCGDEAGEMTCTELLEALELSRCIFLMNYVHGSPLLESSHAFDSLEAAKITAFALGRVLMLDLILRNEDRLPCRQLGWRGNTANLMVANRSASANMNAFKEANNQSRGFNPILSSVFQKDRRLNSANGRLGSVKSEILSQNSYSFRKEQVADEVKDDRFHIVAIDSGVPRRPPAGKRAKDQERYPKLVELVLNNSEYSSNLLYEISGGKLGFPGPEEVIPLTDSCTSLSEADMAVAVHEFRGGFRAALRELQGFHLFLLTLYQKLDGLLRVFLSIINKNSGESEKDDFGTSDSSPLHSTGFGFSSPPISKQHMGSEPSSDSEMHQKCTSKSSSSSGSRGSSDSASPIYRDNWNGRYFKGSGEPPRSLRLTMKLRDFNKFYKADTELSREIDQWNELLRTDVVKLCQENNFNTGFFEGSENNIVVDAYELKVRLEHILERIALISDAANTERPSLVTGNLFIGGALAARSMYTLQHLGITHILCLCSNEIGQSDSQHPDLFEYRNFSISDDEDADISDLFEEASDFIDNVEKSGGKVLVHCFEGKSRSATVVLAYLMLRKGCTLSKAWNMLKKVHRRAQPNDGFAKVLLDLDKRLNGKASMDWQHRRPAMKVCPICGKNAGLSTSSLKLHVQKSHKRLSSGSVDSAMTMEIQKALEMLRISRGGSVSPTQKISQSPNDRLARR